MNNLVNGCIKCKNATCTLNCPLNNDIPNINKSLESGEIYDALNKLYLNNPIPQLTGLFCNGYCFQNCILNKANRPFNFQCVEKELLKYTPVKFEIDDSLKNKKIAIIGAGPTGLALAILLKRHQAQIKIFESHNTYLFTIRNVFPSTKVTQDEIKLIDDYIDSFNFNFSFNTVVGRDVMLDDLRKEYDYVIISSGHNISKQIEMDGDGVIYYSYDYLISLHDESFRSSIPNNFLLYGLGNVSIDLAVYLLNLGKTVKLFYHKPRELSRLSAHDKLKLTKYNLDVTFDTRVTKVDKNLITLEHDKNYYTLEGFTPIFAIGQISDYSFLNNSKVTKDDLTYDENCMTKIENLYVSGDFSSTRWDISTGILTSKKIYLDILKKNNTIE